MSGEELVTGPSSFCCRPSVSVGGRARSSLQLFLFSFCHRSNASVGGRAGSLLPPCLGTNTKICVVLLHAVGSAFIGDAVSGTSSMGNVQVRGFMLGEHRRLRSGTDVCVS